jgi:hypothetical protein
LIASGQDARLAPAFTAARARLGVVAALFILPGIAWWSTADRMRGMDDGPGTELGTVGWFVSVWLVMMAAMMFPSVAHRSPLGFLLGSWRSWLSDALAMGVRHGAWCVGCCWALMASLFALGVRSIASMAQVAARIAVEKMLPWRRPATYCTAPILVALALPVLAAPEAIPGLTIPGENGSMIQMDEMRP